MNKLLSIYSFCNLSILCVMVQLLVQSAPCKGLAAAAPSRVAVLGATGRLGSQTIREFLDREIPVRCLVRPSSVDKLPEEFTKSPLFEVVAGDILAESSRSAEGVFDDETVAPSTELVKCLEGCGGVVACYGATRTTKLADLFSNPEDTDPTHAKQINYRTMIALVIACKAVNLKAGKNDTKIGHIIRITGKGEEPTSIFTVLLNGLGSFCKAWNYQGEVFLRTSLAEDDSIGYTIVRPGVMKEVDGTDDTSKKGKEQQMTFANDDLVLADDGGNDLKVTPVAYSQMANLLVTLIVSAENGSISSNQNNSKVTLASMNPSEANGVSDGKSLTDKIVALQNDRCVVAVLRSFSLPITIGYSFSYRLTFPLYIFIHSRDFPESLVAEHKAAVKAFFTKVSIVLSAVGIALIAAVSKVFF